MMNRDLMIFFTNRKLFLIFLISLTSCSQQQGMRSQGTSPHSTRPYLVDCRQSQSANSMVVIDGHTHLVYDPRLDTFNDCSSKKKI